MKQTTYTIGIPTYVAGASLVRTLTQLYKVTDFDKIHEVIIAVDGRAMSEDVKNAISHPRLKIVQYAKRSGQSARINDILQEATTDYVILLNDDVIVSENALKLVMQTVDKTHADLISTSVLPLSHIKFVEKVISVGVEMNKYLSQRWNNYNNFLSCNGRMLVLSRKYYKQVNIPHRVWNNDAYIYFLCHDLKLKYVHNSRIIVKYRCPQTLGDHFRQSKKFGFSEDENKKYFANVSEQYNIPAKLKFETYVTFFKKKPILTFLYTLLFIKSQFSKHQLPKKGYWETDLTTKNL